MDSCIYFVLQALGIGFYVFWMFIETSLYISSTKKVSYNTFTPFGMPLPAPARLGELHDHPFDQDQKCGEDGREFGI